MFSMRFLSSDLVPRKLDSRSGKEGQLGKLSGSGGRSGMDGVTQGELDQE